MMLGCVHLIEGGDVSKGGHEMAIRCPLTHLETMLAVPIQTNKLRSGGVFQAFGSQM